MRKNILYFVLLILAPFITNGQTWSPVGTGINGSAANTTWSLYSYDSILYAGGWFDTAGGIITHDMAQWNGTNWNAAGSGSTGYINAMAYYQGNLYVGGAFDSMGGVPAHNIAMWNGTTWSPVGLGIRGGQYGVYAMAIYKGELYVGGAYDSAGSQKIYGIAKWNGSIWSEVGTGIYAADEEDGVFTLQVYNGELYAGGGFDSAGGVPLKEIAKWNGTNWSEVGGSMNDGGSVYAFAVYNNNLYAGGFFDTAGGVPVNIIAEWNGSVWSALDSGMTGEAGWATVNALASYNGELYAGGYFDTVNGKPMNCIARWNGTTWLPVGSGINNGGALDAMAVFNNSLYIGGGFDSAGGVYTKNIAMWNSPDAINMLTEPVQISVFPNPASTLLSVKINDFSNNGYYRIYDDIGQQVDAGELTSSITNNINVSLLPAGLYIILVTDGRSIGNTEFIKN